MKHDEIIDCPKSGGNLCYKIQISPDITNYLSLSCGFYTNSLMEKDSDFLQQTMENLPELHKELAWEDEKTGLVWLPNLINIQGQGMVFAYGTDKDNWAWAAVKSVDVPKEEQKEIMGKLQTTKMDMKNMKLFKETDYIEALSVVGILPE